MPIVVSFGLHNTIVHTAGGREGEKKCVRVSAEKAHMSWQAMRIGFDIHTICIIEVSEKIAAHVK